MMERTDLRAKAVNLIGAIWSTVDHESWAKQRLEIWRIFQENIEASASTTPDLARFINSLSSAMRSTPASREASAVAIAECVAAEWAGRLLDLMRDESATVVAMLRVRQQEAKEAREVYESRVNSDRVEAC